MEVLWVGGFVIFYVLLNGFVEVEDCRSFSRVSCLVFGRLVLVVS